LKQGEEHFREAAELNPGDLRKQLDWIRILSRLCRLVNQLVDGSSGADREELLKEADKIVNRSFELCTNLLAKIGEKENMDLVYLSSKIWLEKAHLQRHRFSRKSSLEFMMDGFNFIKLSLSKWVECGAAPPEKSFSSPKHKSSLTKLLNIIQESLNYILNKRLYPELAKSAADLIERCLENSSLQLGEENLFLEYISIPRNLWALVLLAGGRPHLTKHLTKAIRLRGITRFEGVYRENKQLNLCEEVTNASLKSLAEVCPDLEELELRKCYELTDEGINNLLQNCKKIRNLDLSGCWRLTDESLKSLSNVLTGLTVLNLSECLEISDVGIIHLASGKSKSTITSLNLNDLQKITNEGLRHIAEFHQLEELHLYSCKGFSDEPWAKICQGCPQLKILDLKDANTLTSQALKAVATCSQIRELDLGGLMEINDEGLEFIANGLPKLEKIDLNFCWRITDAGVMKLASLCHELQSIILDDCMEVTDESLKLLGKTCQKLEVVSLYNCRRVTDTGVKRIIRHCNNLKSLNLAKCKNITNALLKSISKYPSGKSLESLNLRSCDQIRDEGLKYLSKACVNLKSLILWNCKHVSDEGIRIISEGCHDLEELNTQGLLISDDSMQPLAKGCPKLKTLVIVKCNKVTDIGNVAQQRKEK
jgi:bacterioferritin-associated ferredoxin